MMLLLAISMLCFIIAFIHFITKPVIAFLSAASKEEKLLLDELNRLKQELENTPMRSEYTAYVKVERKIVATQTQLNSIRTARQSKNLMLHYAIPYGCQFVLSFALIIISFMYRYTPVLVFDGHQYDFVPFGALIRFPTGIEGAVSVPFWIFVNGFVSKHVASYV